MPRLACNNSRYAKISPVRIMFLFGTLVQGFQQISVRPGAGTWRENKHLYRKSLPFRRDNDRTPLSDGLRHRGGDELSVVSRSQSFSDSTTSTSPSWRTPWEGVVVGGLASDVENKAGPKNVRYRTQPSVDDATTTSGATIPNLTVSLVKSIVGGGVLALPAGVAQLGDDPSHVLPWAMVLIIAVGGMNAIFFQLVGQVCSWTGATTYTEAWQRTMGQHRLAVSLVVAFKTALSCLAYSMILADSFTFLLAAVPGLEGITRTQSLEAVTVLGLLPLCLMKDLSSLAPFSLLGLAGVGFTAASMGVRFFDGSYSMDQLPAPLADGGELMQMASATVPSFLTDLPEHLQPAFGAHGPELSGLVLACTLATAFVAHYNSPRFHAELENNTMDRFTTVVNTAYTISGLSFCAIAALGFLTFGSHAQGLILNNYSAHDPLIVASRAALALSIVLTFPLPFVGLRDGVLDVWQVPPEERSDEMLALLSVGLLLVVTAAAASIQDLALVLSVGGGTFSTAVASVFPTLMYRAAVAQRPEEGHELKANIALGLTGISVAIGATGVYLALEKVFA